jgi:predicted TIM-barrel fold metal-dependent hydrolase
MHGSVIRSDPSLLEIIGKAGGFPVILGFQPGTPVSSIVADFLDQFPNTFVLGAHFGGPLSPRILDHDQGIKRLFDHPRFNVLFTRQGLIDPAVLEPWARVLIDRLGWNRILWGSEWPVALWRDEMYESTKSYIDLFDPSSTERRLFFTKTP